MKFTRIIILVTAFALLGSCKKYIDVVPDNVATLDYAFRMRSTAERYLYTCYSFLPKMGNMYHSPGMFGGDDLWVATDKITYWANWTVAIGMQNINTPILDFWRGSQEKDPNGNLINKPSAPTQSLWTGISQCNIFLEYIHKVPDMQEQERDQWIAEVKFLKAYYHFFLLRMYGPIPIQDKNIPVSASVEEVRISRKPADEVFNYIVAQLDEAAINLPLQVRDESSELGRITRPIALGLKAKVLVYMASPLFNGNPDYSGYSNKDGTKLFSGSVDKEKWRRAANACKEAIEMCQSLGYKMYEFQGSNQTATISQDTKLAMNARVITDRWNSEIIWAHTGASTTDLQAWATPRGFNAAQAAYTGSTGSIGVPLKIAALYYSRNGVPIEEDVNWNYTGRFNLRKSTAAEKYQIKEGYTTAEFNFNRESRFYGSLGFDGGIWYGLGEFDDNKAYWLETKKGQYGGKTGASWHSVTGYYAKKYAYYTNSITSSTTYTTTNWPWVMLRLSDLYLLYAEALNEIDGPGAEVYRYLDLIRAKAGLKGVQESWANFSKTPGKISNPEGMRDIIHRERSIELAFEAERFWDLRRWKEAPDVLNRPITGWDVDQEAAAAYYREKVIYSQIFNLKDYFWPLSERDLIINKKLVQSPGW